MDFTLDAPAVASCPLKTQNALTPGLAIPPREPVRLAPYVEAVARAAGELLDEVVSTVAGVADLRPLASEPRAERADATLAAMEAGARAIVQAVLPSDKANHRRGRADVLVRGADAASGRPGYQPVRVRGRRVLDARAAGSVQASPLSEPEFAAATGLSGYSPRGGPKIGDQLELVHLWLLLEAAGYAAGDVPVGGLLGTDQLPAGQRVTWVDLTAPSVTRNPREQGPAAVQISPIERYRFEHDLRVGLGEAAASGHEERLLRPIRNAECDTCAWWPVCRPRMDDDDLSLRIAKWPLDVHEIRTLRALGVTTVSDLVAADLSALLPEYESRLTHRSGIADRLRQARHRCEMLVSGVELERTTSGPVPVPAASIEVDLDIEASADNRVYLWGFLVHDRAAGAAPVYKAFGEFSELTPAAEVELAVAAFTWLRRLAGSGQLRVYHYSDYEVVRLTALAARGAGLEWAVQLAQTAFVDLFGVVRGHFFGAHGLGLKNVATSGPGFRWRDPDPGGLNSQMWFEDAVRGPETGRAAARSRVLAYNEDDVRATWHLRQWLRDLT